MPWKRLSSPPPRRESADERTRRDRCQDLPGCALAVLRLTPETRFLVGKTQVTLAQLQKFVATGGTRNVVILYAPRTHAVTRVIVKGELPKTKR